ncbi:TPA: single-stranded DNA-binding protein [Candidatus Dependentiae bacterium]|nr:MAG: Single-stranded DNA-binding protein [candidate division TM6 bacterium GW2011_GWE2_31_21]KKP53545.1 MAG: Single-stranded DNA-binding protein [candidate division TM6 bacterium GW2011_GWF2_33_332]HBS48214.1 single-stranded DNA-binding protein [Candidatus Dependentiae bacterium]HBZ73640.1 single-stranded DNA-binding protein [Candidatus Dependentiae bacterium]
MAGYNRIIFMGNLTRDPESKQLSSGQSLCKLSIASNRQFKNRQTGQMVQEVCFVDVEVWGAQAESSQQYLKQGRSVLIEGRLKLDSWQDKEGQKRSKHSIVADRVVFLTNAAQAESSFGGQEYDAETTSETQIASEAEAPKKSRKKSSETSLDSTETSTNWENGGEVNFKDQKPFEDELPF